MGWACKADLEPHILIATSAGYLLRFMVTPFLAGDIDELGHNTGEMNASACCVSVCFSFVCGCVHKASASCHVLQPMVSAHDW